MDSFFSALLLAGVVSVGVIKGLFGRCLIASIGGFWCHTVQGVLLDGVQGWLGWVGKGGMDGQRHYK